MSYEISLLRLRFDSLSKGRRANKLVNFSE
jgi:hypothetical protein